MLSGYLANEKAQIEIEKLRADVDKTRLEISNSRKLISLERLKAYGGLSGSIVALAALSTISWNIYVFSVESSRRTRDALSIALNDLASDSAQRRGLAALSVSAYIGDADFSDTVIRALSYSLIVENDLQAQKAIIRSLAGAEKRAISNLLTARKEITAEIIPLFDIADPRPEDRGPDYNSEYNIKERSGVSQRIRAKQYALINTSIAVHQLSACDNSNVDCNIDLSYLPLKGFRFLGISADLREANFKGSSLWKADFYGIDLTKGQFVGSKISSVDFRNTKLVDADFTDAVASYAYDASEKRARFQGSDITGARFDRACLAGADFTSVRGAIVEQFRNAYASGAIFDEDFLQKLKSTKAYNEGPLCKK